MKIKLELSKGKECELDIYESYIDLPQFRDNNFTMISYGTCIFVTENIKKQLTAEIREKIENKSLDRFFINKDVLLSLKDVSCYREEILLYDNRNYDEFLKKNEEKIKYNYEVGIEKIKKEDYIYYFTSVLNYPLSWFEIYLASNNNFCAEFDVEDIELNYSDHIGCMREFKRKKEENYKKNKLFDLFNEQEGGRL